MMGFGTEFFFILILLNKGGFVCCWVKYIYINIYQLIFNSLSIPSSTMCLPSSSPCQRLTDWHVSETMSCFSFTSIRDGTWTHTHTHTHTHTQTHTDTHRHTQISKSLPLSLSSGSTQSTRQESMNTGFLMMRNPKTKSLTRTKEETRLIVFHELEPAGFYPLSSALSRSQLVSTGLMVQVQAGKCVLCHPLVVNGPSASKRLLVLILFFLHAIP